MSGTLWVSCVQFDSIFFILFLVVISYAFGRVVVGLVDSDFVCCSCRFLRLLLLLWPWVLLRIRLDAAR